MGRGGESRFKGGQAGRSPKQGGAPGWAGPQKGVATDRAAPGLQLRFVSGTHLTGSMLQVSSAESPGEVSSGSLG